MALVGSRRAGHISIPELDVPLDALDSQLIALCAHFLAVAFFQSGGANEFLGDGKAMKLLLSDLAPPIRRSRPWRRIRYSRGKGGTSL